MTFPAFAPPVARTLCAGVASVLLLLASVPVLAETQDFRDRTPRIAVVSAFLPELEILKGELRERSERSVNGVKFTTGMLEGRRVVLFLSGISVVNAAMTAQLALDRFAIE
ncbi:MAG: 5'-methylthioadenosine/S-adenosylhomocysteine nucleosidase, partial [Boseongicola sp. SB0664_bin_43]|nr:5'-methylthioadenosine/S-adenosylhomocysteine nucleosidase [Boseongicola sp. SB0664_bin_43]